MTILDTILAAIHTLVGGSLSPGEVEAKLDAKAKDHHERLDWRHSIVDLLKLIGQDSSLQARERMAQQLGYDGPYNGSAEMNNFLHARVMEKLARQ